MYHDFFSLPPLLKFSVSASTFSWSGGLLSGISQVLVPELCYKLHTVSSTNTNTLYAIQSFKTCNPCSRATCREPEPSTEPFSPLGFIKYVCLLGHSGLWIRAIFPSELLAFSRTWKLLWDIMLPSSPREVENTIIRPLVWRVWHSTSQTTGS